MKDFILPDIGEGIVECEIVEWRVKEGELIKEDQPVCDVMTDKALVEIPSIYTGKVVNLYYKKGEIAKVHTPLFSMEVMQSSDAQSATEESKVVINNEKVTPTNINERRKIEMPAIAAKKVLSSPAVRRLARELNVDLTQVQGSGEKGRIYKEDVLAFQKRPTSTGSTGDLQIASLPTVTVSGSVRTEAITGVMAAMAKHMTSSVQTIPHFTFCEEIDLTELITLYGPLKEAYKEKGIRLTMMPFFMKALSVAIKLFPQINVQTNDACTELSWFDDHNIGVAVDSKLGLLVPNIKQCQLKSMRQIAIELAQVTSDAREGRLSPESMKGGTISISNIGSLGGTVATPIINKPEAAIVALGRIQTLPRFDEKGNVVARKIMQVSWSADHRIIDGATITRFNNEWKGYLENPASILAELV